MGDEKEYINIKLSCGTLVRVPSDITEMELIKLNKIALAALEETVDNKKKGRLF